jgi:hypothetical protein
LPRRDFKSEPIEMTTVGQWFSWLGIGTEGEEQPDFGGAGGEPRNYAREQFQHNVESMRAGKPFPYNDEGGAGSRDMGGFLDRRMADAALGPPGGAPEPSLARARTP